MRVLLYDDTLDIYDLGYVVDIEDIEEQKSFQRDKLIVDEYELNVKNTDNFFSIDNTNSAFYGQAWLFSTLRIYDDNNVKIWDGIITDIERNHDDKTAVIRSKTSLAKYQNAIVAYESADWETPAHAFENICIAVGFTDYDTVTLTASKNAFTAANCFIKCDIYEEDGSNFQNILEKLAEYSASDCYMHAGKIYFQHWQEYNNQAFISIPEKNISSLQVSTNSEEIINQCYMGYYDDAGVPFEDGASGLGYKSRLRFGIQQMPELSTSGGEQQMQIKDLTSATYIFNSYVKMTTKNYSGSPRPRTKINMTINADIGEYIDLKSYLKINYSGESWAEKVFEIYEFTINKNENTISLICFEV